MTEEQKVEEIQNEETNDIFSNLDQDDPIPSGEEEEPGTPPVEEDVQEPAEDTEEQKEEEPTITLEDLKGELEEQKKAYSGVLKALTAERAQRQEFQGRLNQINETLARAKQRQSEPQEEQKPSFDGIPVEFDDDGNAYIPSKKLTEILKKQYEPLEGQVQKTTEHVQQRDQRDQFTRAVQNVLSKDETYPKAYQEVTNQWQWIYKEANEVLQSNPGYTPPQDAEALFDFLEQSGLSKKFEKQFPGNDPELVIEAFTAREPRTALRKLQRLLSVQKNTIAPPASKDKEKGLSPKLKVLAQKPGNLSSVNNQRGTSLGGEVDVFQNMTLDDLAHLSDADVAKLERALSKDDTEI